MCEWNAPPTGPRLQISQESAALCCRAYSGVTALGPRKPSPCREAEGEGIRSGPCRVHHAQAGQPCRSEVLISQAYSSPPHTWSGAIDPWNWCVRWRRTRKCRVVFPEQRRLAGRTRGLANIVSPAMPEVLPYPGPIRHGVRHGVRRTAWLTPRICASCITLANARPPDN
jgi:hypothetical protein